MLILKKSDLCKHILGVINHNNYLWDELSPLNLESPYHQIDQNFLTKDEVEYLKKKKKELKINFKRFR